MKRILKIITSRMFIMFLIAVIEFFWLWSLFARFRAQAAWIDTVITALSLIVILVILKRSKHLSSDIMWILLISVLPIPGTIFYLLAGADIFSSRTYHAINTEMLSASHYYKQKPKVLENACAEDPALAGQFRYISEGAGFPVYDHSEVEYFPLGDLGFPQILEELAKAKQFIFLEYFIVGNGYVWNSIVSILEEKVKQGVEVRVLYDDMGSMNTLPLNYVRELEAKGIKAIAFNRISPIINVIMNHRDHRKILVIDGHTAFSGGINLADEYINRKRRFGHWKDNVIKIRGNAVWSLTVMFLTIWNAVRHEDSDYSIYRNTLSTPGSGYVIPYSDTPLDNENVGERIYLNILGQSRDYVYIMTPYLIIDTEMLSALTLAAKRGVKVKIVLPGIPDKRIANEITKSFYTQLMDEGIEIYEYTPGFVHSKIFLCDDVLATVGTINLDYRSLYLNFENGICLYRCDALKDIRADFEKTFEVCKKISYEDAEVGYIREFLRSALRVIAPEM